MLKEIAYEAGIPMEHIGRIFGLMNKMEKFNNENIIPEKIEIMPGGLTNNNYKVTAAGITYAVRVAGRGTEEFINRPAEKYNAGLMSKMGINAPLIYYDETTGCQVCKYLDEAITYTPDSFHSAANVKKAVDIFKQCHTSGIVFKSVFDPLKETIKYRELVYGKKCQMYDGDELVWEKIQLIQKALEKNPPKQVPCHNDPISGNWMEDEKQAYFIDWEYAGMNDLMFDLGALSLESDMNENEEQAMLKQYFGDEFSSKQWGDLIINKFLCDILWAYWSILQIASGCDHDSYWDYGLNRYKRAYKLIDDKTLDKAITAYNE